ncbi:hypothetical protein BDN72DRAFT_782399, partial [Pluteus cervinus]
RMGDAGEPCGMPFSTGFISPRVPSMQTAASRSLRNDATHFTYWSGTRRIRSSQRRRLWLTKSK